MLKSDGTSSSEKYIVLSHSMVPMSFYWTEKGKIKTSHSPDPDK
ncbi:hypothetical protein [Acinetobacter sichuanensis]|nr:hypothetical protein [Acinetobacter sichuanensis]